MTPERSVINDTIRLLIVDDEKDVLDTIAEALSDEGYEITCEINPAAALQLCDAENFDIVLTDLMMPGIHGIELIYVLKQKHPQTMVIVITAHGTLDTAIEAIQLGVYDYLNKPIKHSELKNLLHRAAEKIILKRENESLIEKNNKILANLSLLIDVSKIMYQVNNLENVTEMILDTITDYFGIKKCAIVLEDIQSGLYKIVDNKNISQKLISFEFSLPHAINGQKINTDSETIIDSENGKFILLPLSFHEKTLGFLLLEANYENIYPEKDILTTLSILAAQAAPVLNTLKRQMGNSANRDNILSLIRDSILHANTSLSPVSFGLIRLELQSPSGDSFVFKNMVDTAQDFITKQISNRFIIKWKTKDTAFVIMPETDYFNAEIFYKNLKNQTENNFELNEQDAHIIVHFSCIGYPESGDTAQELIDNLWTKLFQEIDINNQHESIKKVEA